MSDQAMDGIMVGLSRQKAGVKLTFLVDVTDVPDWLWKFPQGQLMKLAVVPQDDDGYEKTAPDPERPVKNHKDFRDLPATQQSALLCKDERFWDFMNAIDEEHVKRMIYVHCGIESRAELNKNKEAAKIWSRLLDRYDSWKVNQMYEENIDR